MDQSHRTATLVSRVFEPLVMLLALALVGLTRSSLSGSAKVSFFLVLIFVIIVPPVLILAWAVSGKKVSDWDISKRSQRPLALSVLLVLTVIDLFFVRMYGDGILIGLFGLFIVWLTGFLFITLFWKISGHVGAFSLFSALMVYWYGNMAVPALFLIPVIAWARVVRKDHTVSQTAAGALYSFAVTIGAVLTGIIK